MLVRLSFLSSSACPSGILTRLYSQQLEDLLKNSGTPPLAGVLEDAFVEMSVLASCMNEEKRDAESRSRLVQCVSHLLPLPSRSFIADVRLANRWQARIRGKFPSPLVQPHRKLLLDGRLVLTRIVKKTSEFAEVLSPPVLDLEDGDHTITAPRKTVQAIDCLADPEIPEQLLVAVLTSDLLVLCKPPIGETSVEGFVDLYAVLRMQTKTQPASINGKSMSLSLAISFTRPLSDTAVLRLLSAPSRRQPSHSLLRVRDSERCRHVGEWWVFFAWNCSSCSSSRPSHTFSLQRPVPSRTCLIPRSPCFVPLPPLLSSPLLLHVRNVSRICFSLSLLSLLASFPSSPLLLL